MKLTSKRGLAVAFVALLAISAAAPTMVGALTTDTESTDSTTTSDLTDSTVINEPLNDSVDDRIQVIGDSNTNTSTLTAPESAFTTMFVVNDSDHEMDGATLFTTDKNYSVVSQTDAPDHYYVNVSREKWGTALQYGAEQNVTVDVRVVFNQSESDESTHNITVTVAPNGTDARVQFASGERELTNGSGGGALAFVSSIPFIGSGDGPGAARLSDNVSVVSSTDTITLAVSDDASDSFSEVADAGSTGALSTIGYAHVNGQLVPLFVESADASWLDDDEAYATVASDGSEVTIHNANATFGDTPGSIEVSATGNEGLGATTAWGLLSDYGASWGTVATVSADAVDANGNPFESEA